MEAKLELLRRTMDASTSGYFDGRWPTSKKGLDDAVVRPYWDLDAAQCPKPKRWSTAPNSPWQSLRGRIDAF